MKIFELELYKNHAIFHDGDNVILLDTGATQTIHRKKKFTFLSEIYQCPPNYLGASIKKISKMLGKKITTLLGVDIISKYNVLLDYQGRKVIFSENEIDFVGETLYFYDLMNAPILQMSIGDERLNFFLDSGAQISYLKHHITKNYERFDTKEDFFPSVGAFATNCYKIPTKIGGHTFDVVYGNLPELLSTTLLTSNNLDGIIGSDLFYNFKVLLDFKNKRIRINKYEK